LPLPFSPESFRVATQWHWRPLGVEVHTNTSDLVEVRSFAATFGNLRPTAPRSRVRKTMFL
jgi:hypothetical protein